MSKLFRNRDQAAGSATRSSEQAKTLMGPTDYSLPRDTGSPLLGTSIHVASSASTDLQYWCNHIPNILNLKRLIEQGRRICSGEGGYSEVFEGIMRTEQGDRLVRVPFLFVML